MNKREYSNYDMHYSRAGNKLIPLNKMQRNPDKYVLKRPWFPKDKSASILDFGCATGEQLAELFVCGFENLTGVDLVDKSCQHARVKLADRAEIICADGVEWLEKNDAKYDLIITNDIIEHFAPGKEVNRFLAAIRKSLNLYARFTIRTPNMASIVAGYGRYIDVTHATGYTPISLVQLLEKEGFEDFQFVPDFWDIKALWRFYVPWKNTGIKIILNHILHRLFYMLAKQYIAYHIYNSNIEMSCKAK